MIDNKLISNIQNSLSKEPQVKLAYILGSAVSGRARIVSSGKCVYQKSERFRRSSPIW